MKTFEQFLEESLSFSSSFAEMRKSQIPFVISWQGMGFSESREEQQRQTQQTESVVQEDTEHDWHSINKDAGFEMNKKSAVYHKVHDEEHIKPHALTKTHEKALRDFTSKKSTVNSGGSENVNNYLRNASGDKHLKVHSNIKHTDVHKNIKKLSSVFTKENTNKKNMETYGAVPSHVGEHLQNSKSGEKKVLAGFTSTSTNKGTAHTFSKKYHKDGDKSDVHHIVKYHLEPHTGVSTVHHSEYGENEILLHHGAHITYHKTEVLHPKSSEKPIHLHHVTVHNEHKPLKEYGEYHP